MTLSLRAVRRLLIVGWLGLMCGCRREAPAELRALPGHNLYDDRCRRCHGDWGNGERASRMARRPVDLAGAAFRDTTDLEEIVRIVRGGKGRMKGFGERLEQADLDSVARYVLSLPER
jgi:mono/diheme cytochrome c family protein